MASTAMLLGCSSADNPSTDPAVGKASAQMTTGPNAVSGDSPSRAPVVVSWAVDRSGTLDKAHALKIDIDNWRDEPNKVTLELTGMGLDQRVVKVDAASVQLKGKEKRQIVVPLDQLPVQSVGAPAQIELSGSCVLSDGRTVRLPAISVYVQFVKGYQRAYVSTQGSWETMALGFAGGDRSSKTYQEMTATKLSMNPGGLLSVKGADSQVDQGKARMLYDRLIEPAVHPLGRYIDDEGNLVEVSNSAGRGGVPMQLRSDQMAAMSEIMKYGAPSKLQDSKSPGTKGLWPVFGRYVTMCANWGVQFNDSGLGEDYVNGSGFQYTPARYAVGQIRQLGGSDYWIGHLDVYGCAPNMFLPFGDYYFRLRPDFDTTNNTRFYETRTDPNVFDEFWIPFSVVSGMMLTTVHTGDHPASRMGAVVSQLLVTSDTSIGFTSGHQYRLVYDTGNCEGDGAFSDGDRICYGNDPFGGPHTTASKITIAHEIGHSIDGSGSGLGATNYGWSVTNMPAQCTCDHVQYANRKHCIQSWEHTDTAFVEGFAQFFASKAFNSTYQNDCTFAYYKDVLDDNGNVLHPPVVMSCREAHRWMKNHCDYPQFGGGVEMDWMTFLWNVNAYAESGSNQTTMTDYHMIKRIACTGGTGGFCNYTNNLEFQDLSNAANSHYGTSSDPKALNFRNKGFAHGVNRYN